MTCKKRFIITTETNVIFPYFDEYGRLLSMILEGDQILIVDAKPTEIIDYNLRRVGSSLKGASECAGAILGSSSLAPVSISSVHGIYMSPTESPRSANCIWLAIGQVDTYRVNEHNQVQVKLRNGSVVNLPMSPFQYKQRLHNACTLQYSIETNTRQAMKVKETYQQSYIFTKKERKRNYEGE